MLKFEPISQPKSHFQFMLKKLKKLKQLMLNSKISTLEFNFFNVDPPLLKHLTSEAVESNVENQGKRVR